MSQSEEEEADEEMAADSDRKEEARASTGSIGRRKGSREGSMRSGEGSPKVERRESRDGVWW